MQSKWLVFRNLIVWLECLRNIIVDPLVTKQSTSKPFPNTLEIFAYLISPYISSCKSIEIVYSNFFQIRTSRSRISCKSKVVTLYRPWRLHMISYEDNPKIKVVHFDGTNNFHVEHFSVWSHLEAEIFHDLIRYALN